ncbi:hypothetical protein [Terriglobus sp.]|uniref:hypothetical protein n=1 Tax=Terriglobus sp. TaxID=1889013 RepID=UPI003AFFC6D4
MATIHISEAEALNDFSGLMARVRAGDEVVIDAIAAPSVTMRSAHAPIVRPLSEVLRRVRERGSSVTLDGDFGKDMEPIIAAGREPFAPDWD